MRSVEGLLPPGSIVSLKDSSSFLAIVGTGQFVESGSAKKKIYFDYTATEYPGGVESGNLIHFNREDIESIIFIGLRSDAFKEHLFQLAGKLALLESEERRQAGPVQNPVVDNSSNGNLPYPLNLLPAGSIVYLKGGKERRVIIGVGRRAQTRRFGGVSYFDYAATIYPGGLADGQLFYFNHRDIERVVFRGYKPEMFRQYLRVLSQRLQQVQGARVRGYL